MSDTTIQAKVTLTALTAGIFPLIRTIYLHEYNEAIPIGRSSKNPLKHLVAATDNCWVDSDVVSRDHARLNFDSDLKGIFIEDTNSMHGTRINNKQIPKHDPIPLANNDVVSLGAEVKRGIETYPECRFRVNYELLPYFPSTGRTYQLLSDDDDDEDEPFEISDDEPGDLGPFEVSDDDEEIQRKDGLSSSTPESKANTAPRASDATEDDDVVEIDPPVYESSKTSATTAKPVEAHVESVNESMEALDSDGDSIASSECQPSERPIGRGSSVDIAVEHASIREDIEADDNNQEISSDSGIEFSDDDSWPDSDNSDEDARGFFKDDFLAASDVQGPIFDASETTGPTTNLSNPSLYSPTTEGGFQWHSPEPITQLPQIQHIIAPTPRAPQAPMFPPRVLVESTTLKPFDLEVDLSSTQVKPLSMPSPSDAALKGARATTPPWRTEKQEFLAARVDNRAKFATHWMDIGPMKHTAVVGEPSVTDGSLGDLESEPNPSSKQEQPDSNSNNIVPGIVSLREKSSVQAMLLESPRELPLKRKSDEITVDEPVEGTRTQTAQDIVPARNIKAISDARAMRRAQAVTSVYAYNKASTVADVHTKKVTTATAIPSTLLKADKPTIPPFPITCPIPIVKSSTTPAPSAANSTTLESIQQDQERPAKRQKQEETKASRRFAYATFSGFVAGAGLFVALVATAPDFARLV